VGVSDGGVRVTMGVCGTVLDVFERSLRDPCSWFAVCLSVVGWGRGYLWSALSSGGWAESVGVVWFVRGVGSCGRAQRVPVGLFAGLCSLPLRGWVAGWFCGRVTGEATCVEGVCWCCCKSVLWVGLLKRGCCWVCFCRRSACHRQCCRVLISATCTRYLCP